MTPSFRREIENAVQKRIADATEALRTELAAANERIAALETDLKINDDRIDVLKRHIAQLEVERIEPDWSKAPKWARFHAIQSDGAGHWYEKEPTPDDMWEEWRPKSLSRCASDRDEPKDWRATLRRRPQEAQP